MGNRLRESGNEYGAVTGRPRRCGWYDAVAVRYGVRINGLDALALTKLDVLDGLDHVDICTAYTCGGRTLTEFPSDLAQLAACKPVYESMPGWSAPTKGVRQWADLPEAARRYVARLEEVSGVQAAIISTGSERDDTIVRDDVMKAAEALSGSLTCARSAERRPTHAAASRVDELDARAVARAAVRRDFKRRPRDRRVEPQAVVVVAERHPHDLVRLQHHRRHDLRADRREVDDASPRCRRAARRTSPPP